MFIINFIILTLSFLLGIFGFCQIIGTIKYINNFKISSALFTVVFWLVILALGAFAVIYWLDEYITALCIGYGVSFLLSFTTKPDNHFVQKENNQINNDASNELVVEFISELLFDEDTTKLKEFLLELDDNSKDYFIDHITNFINDMKNKLCGIGDMPQELIDLEIRVNRVLKEIGYNSNKSIKND